jgi:predicted Zn-dependent protease
MDGRDEEALAYLKRAVFEDGVSPTGLYLYARALLRDHSGHWVDSVPDELAEEAERALTQSLELNPAQSETARLLAFVYLVRGVRLEEATALVESALTMTPGRPSLLYLYGQILVRRGDYQSAREALDQMQADATEPSLQQARDELLVRLETAERAP